MQKGADGGIMISPRETMGFRGFEEIDGKDIVADYCSRNK